jgi:hypothetical protein
LLIKEFKKPNFQNFTKAMHFREREREREGGREGGRGREGAREGGGERERDVLQNTVFLSIRSTDMFVGQVFMKSTIGQQRISTVAEIYSYCNPDEASMLV